MITRQLKTLLVVPAFTAGMALVLSPAAPVNGVTLRAMAEWRKFIWDPDTKEGVCYDTGNECHVEPQ